MMKFINNVVKADETVHYKYLQAMPMTNDSMYRIFLRVLKYTRKYSKFFLHSNYRLKSDFLIFLSSKLYSLYTKVIVLNSQTTNTNNYKINDRSKSVAETEPKNWKYQKDNESNWQYSGKEINVWLKLSRSLLDKCRYTSLELAVRSAMLNAYPTANFRTTHPVMHDGSENNKEQCRILWQRQTTVDS